MKVIYLVSGYPSKDNPTHGIFHERAAELLGQHVDLTVIQFRFLKPGRELFRKVQRESYDLIIVSVPYIPFLYSRLYRLNTWLFALLAFIRCKDSFHQADIVHAGDGNMSIVAALIKTRFRFKLLAQFIGGDINQDIPKISNAKYLSKWQGLLDGATFNSLDLRDQFMKHFRTNIPLETIYRGVDLERFLPAVRQVHKLSFYFLGGLPDYKEFLNGRNTKGGKTLMEAWALIDEMYLTNEIELHFAGPDSDIEIVQIWRSRLQRPDRVFLYGKIHPKDIPSFHRAHNVAVIPSLEEGLPNAGLEAAATGNLIISTDVGGLKELVYDNLTGWVCKPGDPKALFELIKKAIEFPEEVTVLGNKARQLIVEKFNSKHFALNYLIMYQKILSNT